MGSSVSYTDFLCHRQACPSYKCLCNLLPSPACREQQTGHAEFHSNRYWLSSTLLALVTQCPAWEPSRVTLPFRGLGRQLASPPRARWCWTCHSWADPLSTPWEEPKLGRSGVGCPGGTEHKIHPWYHHQHQPQCSFGAEEPLISLHILFVATAASLVTTPVHVNCWRDSRASQMVRKLPDRR